MDIKTPKPPQFEKKQESKNGSRASKIYQKTEPPKTSVKSRIPTKLPVISKPKQLYEEGVVYTTFIPYSRWKTFNSLESLEGLNLGFVSNKAEFASANSMVYHMMKNQFRDAFVVVCMKCFRSLGGICDHSGVYFGERVTDPKDLAKSSLTHFISHQETIKLSLFVSDDRTKALIKSPRFNNLSFFDACTNAFHWKGAISISLDLPPK